MKNVPVRENKINKHTHILWNKWSSRPSRLKSPRIQSIAPEVWDPILWKKSNLSTSQVGEGRPTRGGSPTPHRSSLCEYSDFHFFSCFLETLNTTPTIHTSFPILIVEKAKTMGKCIVYLFFMCFGEQEYQKPVLPYVKILYIKFLIQISI